MYSNSARFDSGYEKSVHAWCETKYPYCTIRVSADVIKDVEKHEKMKIFKMPSSEKVYV